MCREISTGYSGEILEPFRKHRSEESVSSVESASNQMMALFAKFLVNWSHCIAEFCCAPSQPGPFWNECMADSSVLFPLGISYSSSGAP